MKHDEFIGRIVTYISGSGREYQAIVDAIPDRPDTGYTNLPIVSLSFHDQRWKLVRKERVCPYQSKWMTTQVWRL